MQEELFYRNNFKKGFNWIIKPNLTLLKQISFGVLCLSESESYKSEADSQERVLVILGGSCSVKVGEHSWPDLGERKNVFDGAATAIYIPRNFNWSVTAKNKVDIAVCISDCIPGKDGAREIPQVIYPKNVARRIVGKNSWEREVHDIVPSDFLASRLIVGETFNSPGGWSSSPPHKHDKDNLPIESKFEELYFFQMKPEQGFGVQRIYDEEKDLNKTYTIKANDVVIIPSGYHPVVAGPGYRLYYLWVLAGDNRKLIWHEDPMHKWINDPKQNAPE